MTDTTVLLRQIHPTFINNGKITSQSFMPFPKDSGLLSVYNGDMTTPKEAYFHFTQTLRFASHSIWGVTKVEAESESLPVRSDPQPGFDSHAIIDFTEIDEKDWRKKAKRLQQSALNRGCIFFPS